MPNLTCPLPTNINPLSSNGFNFSITKIPEVSFFCQEVSLPALSLPQVDIKNPLSTYVVAGDIIAYEDLNIQFMIDEDMSNYTSIYNWIIGLGFPRDNAQYANFINLQSGGYSRLSKESSDGTLTILGSNNHAVKTVKFIDLVPISLNSLTFQSTNNEVTYLVGNASFRYNYYEFV